MQITHHAILHFFNVKMEQWQGVRPSLPLSSRRYAVTSPRHFALHIFNKFVPKGGSYPFFS